MPVSSLNSSLPASISPLALNIPSQSLFRSFIVRPLWGGGRSGDRLRTVLSILAVGLGVGVILAIQLANRSSIGSFEASLQEISGRTNLSILGTNGFDELLLPRLRE